MFWLRNEKIKFLLRTLNLSPTVSVFWWIYCNLTLANGLPNITYSGLMDIFHASSTNCPLHHKDREATKY